MLQKREHPEIPSLSHTASRAYSPKEKDRLDELRQQEDAAKRDGSFWHRCAESHAEKPNQLEAVLQNVVQPDVVLPVKVVGHC